MRLESLFDRMMFFARPGDPKLHQVALSALFDLLDATERTDMKGSVLQDLERQRTVLIGLKDHPGVESKTLNAMLNEIDREEQNVISLEDPVEYSVPGVSQSQVRPEIG